MRIVVASDIEIGSRRAHAINVIKTAGGFRRLGHEVELCVRASGADPLAYLHEMGEDGLEVSLAPPDGRHPGDRARTGEFGEWVSFRDADMVYARHFDAALACARAGLTTVCETHAYVGDDNQALLDALRATRDGIAGVATISDRLRSYYIARGAAQGAVHVVPDGVDVELFARPDDGTRTMRGRPVVRYAGHLYDYKGIPTILEAAARLPEIEFELIGGTEEDIKHVRGRVKHFGLSNVSVVGWIPHRDLAPMLWEADVLLLPPSAREASKDWTSPVKLGEYLASRSPIVASSIPALQDWVDASIVRWFDPDDGASLAEAIGSTLGEDRASVERRTARGAALAERLSYPNRARRLMSIGLGRLATAA